MIKIPNINEIYERVADDLRTRLGLTDTQLKTVLDAFASVQASEIKLLYLFISNIQKNLFPDTADSEYNGGTLEHFGRIYLNREPNPATEGIFNSSVTGEAGSILPSGLNFKSNDTSKNPGRVYILDNEYTLTGTDDVIQIRSESGGVNYDLSVNDTLTITQPIIGVDNLITITEVVQQPLSAETQDDYRGEILQSIQLEPQGGSKTDYRVWSSTGGVRLVYPYVKDLDSGTVQIYVEATTSDSSDGLGTPTQAILNNVLDVLDFDPDDSKPTNQRGRRPIQAVLEVLPIELIPIDVEIVGLQNSTQIVKSAIRENLELYLYDIRPFVSGADLQRNKNDILYVAGLQSVVTGVLESSNFFVDFEMLVDGESERSTIFEREKIPYLRNVNYS